MPAASAIASSTHRAGESDTGVTATATAMTTEAAAVANTDAESSRAPILTPTVTGSVRRYVSHGEARSTAMPTPNWKKATPIAAKPANVAMRTSAPEGVPGTAKKTKNNAGKASVGTT